MNLLELFERNGPVAIEFDNNGWRSSLPTGPGLYFIETNTPIHVLKRVGQPENKGHYDIPERIISSRALGKICILPKDLNPFYIVYSGEAGNIKSRIGAHISGHCGTGCLALRKYPTLRRYEWRVYFLTYYNRENDLKLIRIFAEQIWRTKNGWPILCKK